MNLTELSKTIRFDNASKGFDPLEGGIDRYLLLAISEICEAQNELRDGYSPNEIYYRHFMGYECGDEIALSPCISCGSKKPEGFPVEIADAIIRLLDICGKFEVEVGYLQGYVNIKRDTDIESYLLHITKKISSFHIYGDNRANAEVLVDPINRLFALCNTLKIDILKVIDEKLAYNRSRPPKHGRKF